MWLGIIELVKKILDFVTPWSTYWVERRKSKNQKKEQAQKNIDKAVKDENSDDFLDGINDKLGS